MDEASGRLVVALFNLSDEESLLSIGVRELGEDGLQGEDAALYELWEKQESRAVSGRIEAQVPAHGVRVYRMG